MLCLFITGITFWKLLLCCQLPVSKHHQEIGVRSTLWKNTWAVTFPSSESLQSQPVEADTFLCCLNTSLLYVHSNDANEAISLFLGSPFVLPIFPGIITPIVIFCNNDCHLHTSPYVHDEINTAGNCPSLEPASGSPMAVGNPDPSPYSPE